LEAPPAPTWLSQAKQNSRWTQSAQAEKSSLILNLLLMLRAIQRVSGFTFYALGATFILAWILVKTGTNAGLASAWMQGMDLPLIFSAFVYGGLCLYFGLLSFFSSWIMRGILITILTLVFIAVLVMNFL
jgi:hypothetical protein